MEEKTAIKHEIKIESFSLAPLILFVVDKWAHTNNNVLSYIWKFARSALLEPVLFLCFYAQNTISFFSLLYIIIVIIIFSSQYWIFCFYCICAPSLVRPPRRRRTAALCLVVDAVVVRYGLCYSLRALFSRMRAAWILLFCSRWARILNV